MGALREAAALVKPALAGAAFGCLLYFAADTASDIYVFFAVRRAALERAAASADVADLVGEPYAPGPWYNGTLGFSHRDRVAHVTFQLAGSRRTTDVVARAARRPEGPRLNVLYNLAGPGVWELVACSAMFPGEGGLAAPFNLMDAPAPGAAALGGGGGECLPCQQQQGQQGAAAGRKGSAASQAGAGAAGAQKQQQQQHQDKQQGPPPQGQRAGRSWWWWWGGGGGGDSGGEGAGAGSGGSGGHGAAT